MIHGSRNTYNDHKCRCDQCREAHNAYQRKYWERRRAKVAGADDLIDCACGCGTKIRAANYHGRPRRFERGHGNEQPVAERLWAKVDKSGECWIWTGSVTEHGYGHILRDGKFVRVHRLAYELLVGPIPEGLVIDHLCRTPACVNPDHLEPVTQAVNLKRGIGVGGDRRPEMKGITW